MIPSELCIPISERKPCSPEALDSYQSLPSTIFSRNTAAKTWFTARRSTAPHIRSSSSPPSTSCPSPFFTTFTPLSESEEFFGLHAQWNPPSYRQGINHMMMWLRWYFCSRTISAWMQDHRPTRNLSKTELLVFMANAFITTLKWNIVSCSHIRFK